MTVRVFVHERLKRSCPEHMLSKLIDDFKIYKTTGKLPDLFGRDVPYNFPFSVREAGLQHIHVKDAKAKNWHIQKISFNKTSDTALIYCQGAIQSNCYLLIAVLENAHQTYRSMPLYLAELGDVAEKFRESF